MLHYRLGNFYMHNSSHSNFACIKAMLASGTESTAISIPTKPVKLKSVTSATDS